MAGIDGVEALARIRQQYGKLKVIMVTGKDPDEDSALKRCTQLGADGYIHKPLQLDELERTVLAILNKGGAVAD
jgi:CheY-like chemotaxis protein